MIKSFKHKGLKKLFETGKTYGVNPQHAERLRKILALLETSETIDDMDLPGLNLHDLKGKRKDTFAVNVSGNWRVTFKLRNGDVLAVNYEDYH
jgi:proteic killer suppression protein